jgi:outer membrane protein
MKQYVYVWLDTNVHAVMVILILAAVPMVAWADRERQEEVAIQSKTQTPDLIGIGIGYRTSVYQDGDDRILPNYLYNSDRIYIHGTHFAYRYFTTDTWSLDAGFKVESFGEDHDGSDTINDIPGIEKISKLINGKFSAEYSFDAHRFRLEVSHDLSNEHNGAQLEVLYTHSFSFERIKLSPFVGFEWWSEDVTDYYFGVSRDSDRASLYQSDSMMHNIVGFQALMWLAPNHAVHFRLKHTLCDDAVNESQLTDRDQHTFTTLSYVYRL